MFGNIANIEKKVFGKCYFVNFFFYLLQIDEEVINDPDHLGSQFSPPFELNLSTEIVQLYDNKG